MERLDVEQKTSKSEKEKDGSKIVLEPLFKQMFIDAANKRLCDEISGRNPALILIEILTLFGFNNLVRDNKTDVYGTAEKRFLLLSQKYRNINSSTDAPEVTQSQLFALCKQIVHNEMHDKVSFRFEDEAHKEALNIFLAKQKCKELLELKTIVYKQLSIAYRLPILEDL